MSWVRELDKRLSEIETRQAALTGELKALREVVKHIEKQAREVAPHTHPEYADGKLVAGLVNAQKALKSRLDDVKDGLEQKLEMVTDELQAQLIVLSDDVEKLEARQKRHSEELTRLLKVLAERGLIKLVKR